MCVAMVTWRQQKLMRQDDVAWVDRLLASNVAKRLPSETDWDRLLEQTKNLSKEVKEVKVHDSSAFFVLVLAMESRVARTRTRATAHAHNNCGMTNNR
jgi:hypothetical protein